MQNEILSDLEKAKVQSFMADKEMVEAVKKVILSGIYYNGTLRPGQKSNPTKNFALGFNLDRTVKNEDIGADVRAVIEGISLVELGFGELGKIAVPGPVKSPMQVNEAE